MGVLILVAGIIPVIGWSLLSKQASPPQVKEATRYIPLLDQTLVVITAFVVKPLYMLISLVLAWLLHRARSRELIALRWGLLAFFLGEAFCAINYLVFNDKSILMEFLHSYGMVVSFGLFGYALLEGLDKHIVQYSQPDKRCAFASLCRECVKSQHVPCRVRQASQLMLLVLLLLAFIPLCVEAHEISYYTYIYGTLYNYTWLKPEILFETRYCPLLAFLAFMTALVNLQISKDKQVPDSARAFLSAGVAAFGFGLFRLFLNGIFSHNLAWASIWEEITEFMLMLIITCLLWWFRRALDVPFPTKKRTAHLIARRAG